LFHQKHISVTNGSGACDIDLDGCATYKDILAWVLYLLENSWVTKEMIEEFVTLALSHHNLEQSSAKQFE
jgi:hypothetical protein